VEGRREAASVVMMCSYRYRRRSLPDITYGSTTCRDYPRLIPEVREEFWLASSALQDGIGAEAKRLCLILVEWVADRHRHHAIVDAVGSFGTYD